MLSLAVKKLDAFKFDRVVESDNTARHAMRPLKLARPRRLHQKRRMPRLHMRVRHYQGSFSFQFTSLRKTEKKTLFRTDQPFF